MMGGAGLRALACMVGLVLACGGTAQAFDPTLVPVFADRIVVKKKERRLLLYKDDVTLASYPVNLGRQPRGHKREQGDSRTPEGRYVIDWRKANSDYHLALHVSYPNAVDSNEAEKRGVHPGGNIMIHGLPNWYAGPDDLFSFRDWTDGCIALNNRQIEIVWAVVPEGTPIEILP